MKWPALRYARASSLSDVWSTQDAIGDAFKVVAGGQSLLATLAFRLSDPGALLDISGIAALKGITVQGNVLRIGALTTHAELGRNAIVVQHAPLLHQAVPLIAHAAIRNRGTLGGNLAYADPASELPACLVALRAVVIAVSRRGERRIEAEHFFRGLFETALASDELISAVEVPVAVPGQVSIIQEVCRRAGDYAMAGLAAWSDGSESRLVYFAVGDGPVLAKRASAAMFAGGIAAAQAALLGELSPNGDIHSSAEMKLHLAKTLTARVAPLILPAGSVAA
ncbi:CoxM Aerobic-type carbon monoxide dehydrogenase, middle subunit CoxM/CutM homologs [Rhabdaerophilaceae bacterium]